MYSVTKTVGTGGDYTTLKAAFDAINAGSITGTITLEIISNTTETASAVLNESGTGSANYNGVFIHPTGIYEVSGNLNGPLVDLNGADKVIIDGRIPGNCDSKDLSFSNINTNTSATTIRFNNSASYNEIKYCDIKGSAAVANRGVITFWTSFTGTGNIKNNINNCNIHEASAGNPFNCIYSTNSFLANSQNFIINNNIYNFFANSAGSNGILIGDYASDWLIQGNSFYQTTSITPTSGRSHHAINIQTSSSGGDNMKIFDNYIGGSAPQCGGSAWTYLGSQSTKFYAIRLDLISSTTYSSIQGNTIKNININTNSSSTTSFTIFSIPDGKTNIGTIKGNVIGETTGNGSINYTNNNPVGAQDYVTIIHIGTSVDTAYIYNNSIGSITLNSTTTANAISATCIYSQATYSEIVNNLVGSKVSSNSIQHTNANTSRIQDLYAIHTTKMSVIKNNVICNLNNTSNRSFAQFGTTGILIGHGEVINNKIYNLSSSAPISAAYSNVTGIENRNAASASPYINIEGNTIYDIMNTNASSTVGVCGISCWSATSGGISIKNNFIHSLGLSSSNNGCQVYGIYAGNITDLFNNVVSVGETALGDYRIWGIYLLTNGGLTTKAYFNTVSIVGTVTSGYTRNTICYEEQTDADITDIRNNIFSNSRAFDSPGSGNHYAIYLPGTTSLTIDYNNYYVPCYVGTFNAYLGGTQTTLANWQTATGQDANSLNTNPNFINAKGEDVTYFFTTINTLNAVSGTGVTQDFFYMNRDASSPKMGALEGCYWKGDFGTNFSNSANYLHIAGPPTSGNSFTFLITAANHCILNQNYLFSNISSDQNTYRLDVNGYRLRLTGELKFTNGAQIDVSSNASSIIEFEGTEKQYINPNNFLNGEISKLVIDNPEGVELLGDITINNSLTFTQGKLYTKNYKIIFKDNATVSGANSSRYIVGNAEKIGNDAFTFDIGDDNYYAPIGISAPSVITDAFMAYYTPFNPRISYAGDCISSELSHVSQCEFWNLERTAGSSSVSVTLSWNTRSCGVTSLADLRVAHWTGTEWENIGNTSTLGDVNEGKVTSDPVSSFSPFTLSTSSSTPNVNPLPIRLTEFVTQCYENYIAIHWTTATEINNQYFDIEKSNNGKDWYSIGTVEGAINSHTSIHYQFLDFNIPSNNVYYRLKQVDLDGKHTYSKIINSACINSIGGFSVYPNPTQDIINIETEEISPKKYVLFNNVGQKIQENSFSQTTQNISLQNLPNGVYVLQIQNDYNTYETKILKY